MPTLNWIGKEKVINHHQQVPFRVLEQQHTYGDDDSGNMIVHGDNLDALKALLPQYDGKIKLIYIDPPYNTGNEGWVYNDNVNDPKIRKWLGEVVGKEGEDLSRHDKWLCMMYPRLRLLQRLLADDGAIFISIDDNEQANLKLICDEIFGSSNFIANIVWEKNYSPRNDAKQFSSSHDLLVVYSKTPSTWTPNLLPRTDRQNKMYKYDDNDGRGLWRPDNLLRMEHRDNGIYGITGPTGEVFFPTPGTSWRHPESDMQQMIADNRIWFGTTGTTRPQKKRYLNEVRQGITPQTIFKYTDAGHTQEAKKAIREILGAMQDLFATPKPVKLLELIIHIASSPGDIILDSFAGSGTTAHAVLNMNKRDGGNRRFILVEMEDYAESITAERIKRVINGYGNTEGTGGGFSFYDLGERLLMEDGNLNKNLPIERVYEYIWYTETRTFYKPQSEEHLLGVRTGTAYYFYYEKEQITVLDHDFLSKIKTKTGNYLIYADINTLSSEELEALNIRFKKIPRDIIKL